MRDIRNVFGPADILLPVNAEMRKWSVIACDQFSSQPEYWDETEKTVGDSPSTLRLMLPEAYLESVDTEEKTAEINKEMQNYIKGGIFKTVEDSYVFVEREISDGRIRYGLVGVLDLEEYDYTKASQSLIRASEETVVSRLPPRIKLREGAVIELPHTMVLIDDPENTVIAPFSGRTDMEKLYDFDLMQGGGHISGYRISGKDAEAVKDKLTALVAPERYKARYGETSAAPVLYVMGDGNHSLAAAKACWEELKKTLDDEEKASHPARFSLVEIVNIHDPSLDFEPIHRVIFNTDPEELINAYVSSLPENGSGSIITAVWNKGQKKIFMPTDDIGTVIRTLQDFLDDYIKKNGGKTDYIHGDDTLVSLSQGEGDIGFLLPPLSKAGLFKSVIASGVLPRKSFSMGHAEDKRYYLECRKIK